MKIISGVERNLNYTWESERACLWKFLCIWSPKSQPSKEKGLEYSKRKEQQDVFKGLEAGSLWLLPPCLTWDRVRQGGQRCEMGAGKWGHIYVNCGEKKCYSVLGTVYFIHVFHLNFIITLCCCRHLKGIISGHWNRKVVHLHSWQKKVKHLKTSSMDYYPYRLILWTVSID